MTNEPYGEANKIFVKIPWKNPASGRMATIGGYYYPDSDTSFVKWYSVPGGSYKGTAFPGHIFEIWTFPQYMREMMQKAILVAGRKQFEISNRLSLQNKL